jgi:hypothetical protein
MDLGAIGVIKHTNPLATLRVCMHRGYTQFIIGIKIMKSHVAKIMLIPGLAALAGCTASIPATTPEDLVPLSLALCEIQDALTELDQRNKDPRRRLAVVPDEISVTLALTKSRTNSGGVAVNLAPAIATVGLNAEASAKGEGVNTIKISFKHFLAMGNDNILGKNIADLGHLGKTAKFIARLDDNEPDGAGSGLPSLPVGRCAPSPSVEQVQPAKSS